MNAPLERAAQQILQSTGTLPMHLVGRLVSVLDSTGECPFEAVFVGLVAHGYGGDYRAAIRRLSTSEVEVVPASRVLARAPRRDSRTARIGRILTGLCNPLLLMSLPDREALEESALHDAITATEFLELAHERARSR